MKRSTLLVVLLLVLAPYGCGRSGAASLAAGAASADATAGASFGSFLIPAPWISAKLASLNPASLTDAELWELAECSCSPGAAAAWMAQRLDKTGALPQVLTPDVRSAIRGNSLIKDLFGSAFGQDLSSVLLQDQTLATEISSSIWQRLVQALPATATATTLAAFNLDGFQSGIGGSGAFAVESQTAAWQLILATPAIWRQTKGETGTYVAAQAVHVMRLFSEWQYLFGIGAGNGPTYGGLSVALSGSGALAPYDPRTAGAAPRMISGAYSVTYPAVDALMLAESAKETWIHQAGPAALNEQAQLWRNAATALNRSRPRNRAGAAALFGKASLLPTNAYLLPLAFLPGMRALLSLTFIDKAGQTIRSSADSTVVAPLASTVRLGLALAAWNAELADTSDLTLLDAASATEISTGLSDLQDALRLTINSVVVDPMLASAVAGTAGSASLTDTAEALILVSQVERTLMPSPVLRQTVNDDAATLLGGPVATAWQAGTGAAFSASDVMALAHLAAELAASEATPPDLAAAAAHLTASAAAALSAWGEGGA